MISRKHLRRRTACPASIDLSFEGRGQSIDQAASHWFLPQANPTGVGDFVAPGGHGTRVAGVVLYGEAVPDDGTPQLPFWIQNARVLDSNNRMPVEMFPPEVIRAAVERFHQGAKQTKIFNHSINASGYCRTRYMSASAPAGIARRPAGSRERREYFARSEARWNHGENTCPTGKRLCRRA